MAKLDCEILSRNGRDFPFLRVNLDEVPDFKVYIRGGDVIWVPLYPIGSGRADLIPGVQVQLLGETFEPGMLGYHYLSDYSLYPIEHQFGYSIRREANVCDADIFPDSRYGLDYSDSVDFETGDGDWWAYSENEEEHNTCDFFDVTDPDELFTRVSTRILHGEEIERRYLNPEWSLQYVMWAKLRNNFARPRLRLRNYGRFEANYEPVDMDDPQRFRVNNGNVFSLTVAGQEYLIQALVKVPGMFGPCLVFLGIREAVEAGNLEGAYTFYQPYFKLALEQGWILRSSLKIPPVLASQPQHRSFAIGDGWGLWKRSAGDMFDDISESIEYTFTYFFMNEMIAQLPFETGIPMQELAHRAETGWTPRRDLKTVASFELARRLDYKFENYCAVFDNASEVLSGSAKWGGLWDGG